MRNEINYVCTFDNVLLKFLLDGVGYSTAADVFCEFNLFGTSVVIGFNSHDVI